MMQVKKKDNLNNLENVSFCFWQILLEMSHKRYGVLIFNRSFAGIELEMWLNAESEVYTWFTHGLCWLHGSFSTSELEMWMNVVGKGFI